MGKKIVFVGAGGFMGTLCRFGLSEAVPAPAGGFPLMILLINLAGCLFLGWFLTCGLSSTSISAETRLLIGTGFTGSFTTFSTFTVDTIRLIHNGQGFVALLYILLSTFGGILMSLFGVWLGRAMNARQEGETL
ncbi:fluoride efflux transporter CrcB [Paenibacillus dakarensis]|uniref:fluoride efflux transporter CrcB n=1 Tax=Paenibacillus dakarensis TaxID=1527293 RepID=UPI0006D55329|nr:fluoride efflux transporter CrcB [Paenibacillus dakarensis]